MAILLITHDLGVVANMADEVVVIYHGKVVEAGQVSHIFRSPQHPYLKALLNAVPHFDMKRGERLVSLREVKVDVETLLKGPESKNNAIKVPAPAKEKQDGEAPVLRQSFSVARQEGPVEARHGAGLLGDDARVRTMPRPQARSRATTRLLSDVGLLP